MEGSTIRRFTAADGPAIQAEGDAFVKKPNPVYMTQYPKPFSVETNNGTMFGDAGDFVVYDPISGHVWPITPEYAKQHYVPASEVE